MTNASVPTPPVERWRVVVAVGTHRRNELLERLLQSVERSAGRAPQLRVGVVIIDDNDDARARPIAEAWVDRFELGVHYRHTGSGNISLVRNTALAVAGELGDWVAMTDDDCEVSEGWLGALVQTATGAATDAATADAVTGPLRLRVPPGSPRWLTDQPFLADGQFDFTDGESMETAATNNSMISSSWLAAHPDHRFSDELGVVGGEDMVFYRGAHQLGLRIRYAADAVVWGNETPERTSYRAVLRSRLWLGNTEAVTNLTLAAATPGRLAVRAARRFAEASIRPVVQIARGRPPQARYAIAQICRSVGMLLGALGVRIAHH